MSGEDLRDYSLHELFRMEVEGQRQVMIDGLLMLERTPTAAGELEVCMRGAHSLKGAARIVGLTAAVSVAHMMEDCLVEAIHGRITLGNNAIDVLLRGVDLLGKIADTPIDETSHWTRDDTPEVNLFRAALAAVVGIDSTADPLVAIPAAEPASDAKDTSTAESEERVLRVSARSLNRVL